MRPIRFSHLIKIVDTVQSRRKVVIEIETSLCRCFCVNVYMYLQHPMDHTPMP